MQYDCKKQLRSFGYAWKGIRDCVGKEQNLNFHLVVSVLVVVAGLALAAGLVRLGAARAAGPS